MLKQKKVAQRRRLKLSSIFFIAVAILGVLWALWFMINSPTFMVFGTIIDHVETEEKVVALTFDDGPLPGTTEKTLDILAKANVPATFFVIGTEVKKHPQQFRAIIESGAEVGSHGYSHQYMAVMLPSDVKKEVELNDQLIRSFGYTGRIQFRTPYNAKFLTLPYYLMKQNRPSISRDVITTEGTDRSAKEITDDVVRQVKPGSIILMHPMYDHTASSREALSTIVEQLRADGYRFVTVSQLLAFRGQ